jgi:hypothetical protein
MKTVHVYMQIMTRELLHDLALYKKSREKAISAAARSIIAVFRQVIISFELPLQPDE